MLTDGQIKRKYNLHFWNVLLEPFGDNSVVPVSFELAMMYCHFNGKLADILDH